MRKSFTTIVLAILLLFIALITFKTYFSFYLSIFGFIAILDTIFFLREYYNKTNYLILVIIFLIGTSTLYFSSLPPFNNHIYNYVVTGMDEMEINTIVIGTFLLILMIVGSIKKMEKYGKSLDLQNKIIKIEPKNIKALYRKGIALAELEEYKPAIEIYDQILRLDPKNVKALSSKGFILRISRRNERPSKSLKKQ